MSDKQFMAQVRRRLKRLLATRAHIGPVHKIKEFEMRHALEWLIEERLAKQASTLEHLRGPKIIKQRPMTAWEKTSA